MIIASWLVAIDPRKARAAQAALRCATGGQIREKQGSRYLVLLTETARDIAAVRQDILATPGVSGADPIAFFDDEDPERRLVRLDEPRADEPPQSLRENPAPPAMTAPERP
jgi:hypothetical protein